MFTYDGAELYLCQTGLPPTIVFNDFHGQAALVNLVTLTGVGGSIAMTGDGTGGQILGAGVFLASNPGWLDSTSPADATELLETYYVSPSWDYSNLLEPTLDPVFARATLNQMRTEQPSRTLSQLPAGVTDVRVYRVSLDSGIAGLHVVP